MVAVSPEACFSASSAEARSVFLARDTTAGRVIARRMHEAFFIDEDDWKAAVCVRAKEVVERALAGMAAFVPEARR